MAANNPEFEKKIKRDKEGKFSDKEKNIQPKHRRNVGLPYESSNESEYFADCSTCDEGFYQFELYDDHCPNCGGEVNRLTPETPLRARALLAQDPSAPAELLARLAEDKEPFVRERVADNPNTSRDTLDRLAGDSFVCVNKSVARNPSTSAETLERLAQYDNGDSDSSAHVRRKAAKNPNMPVASLVKLADDKVPYVRHAAATNPNTPTGTLNRLAQDGYASVRANVAGNPNTPAETLERLADDEEPDVQESVAGNPSTPAGTLYHLALVSLNEDSRTEVLKLAAHQGYRSLDESTVGMSVALANNPNTPIQAVESFANCYDMRIRRPAQEALYERSRTNGCK